MVSVILEQLRSWQVAAKRHDKAQVLWRAAVHAAALHPGPAGGAMVPFS